MCPPGSTAIWTVEKGKATPLIALPTDGDSAYPGLISTQQGKLVISYYSQHAYMSGVLEWQVKPRSHNLSDLWQTDDDVYVAEIILE
jgi:hypothetical protein